MLCTKVFSPAARGEADEEDAEAPARVEGGASSSVANAGAEGAASTAGFSSSGAVAVSVTARRAVRNRVDLGTADVIGDEPETRRPRGTRTRGARDGAPAAAVGDTTANILGRRGARRVWVRRECGPERVCRVRLRFVSKRRHAKRPEPRTGEIFDLERRSSLRKSLIVSWFPFVKPRQAKSSLACRDLSGTASRQQVPSPLRHARGPTSGDASREQQGEVLRRRRGREARRVQHMGRGQRAGHRHRARCTSPSAPRRRPRRGSRRSAGAIPAAIPARAKARVCVRPRRALSHRARGRARAHAWGPPALHPRGGRCPRTRDCGKCRGKRRG